MANKTDRDQTENAASFANIGLSDETQATLATLGYKTPTPIQALAIPPLCAGRDVIAQAQTGTGKTAAFALPLLEQIDLGSKKPQVLVLTPTRELALQVCEAMRGYAQNQKALRVVSVYGGQEMSPQLRALRRGAHVVVGTPGRLLDHIRRETLVLDQIRALVLDEADEMLRMGFLEDVESILENVPGERQTALFSATMPARIAQTAKRFLNEPVRVSSKEKALTAAAIEQRYVLVTGEGNKLEALARLLEVEPTDGVIVFVRTKVETVEIAQKLEAGGHAAFALNGDMNQQLRQRTVDRFKQGEFDCLVSTDVAARGLDVPRVSHVINYDMPFDNESYVHRIGRTGRAGRTGKAILFVSRRQKRFLSNIERHTQQQIEKMSLPDAAAVSLHRINALADSMKKALERKDIGFYRDVVEQICEANDWSAMEAASVLTYLAQQDRPLNVPDRAIEDLDRNQRQRKNKERSTRESRDTDWLGQRKGVYRIEVGSQHGLEPRTLVDALHHAGGLPRQCVGTIRIGTAHTTLELPSKMPAQILKHLKQVRVLDQELNMSKISNEASPEPGRHRGTKKRRDYQRPKRREDNKRGSRKPRGTRRK